MSKIIDRIQKLLRLAQNAGSEAEAALAAQRAADMMAEHEIQEAELALASETARVAEPIEKAFEVTKTKKRVAWHMRVVGAVARTYGAQAYWLGGKVVLFGRLSTVQAASYTSQYLMREVERMTDKEAPAAGGYSKSFRNAFRLGCSNRVSVRLDEQERKRKDEAYQAMMAASAPEDVVTEDELDAAADEEVQETAAEEAPVASSMALAVVEKDREEVQAEYKDFSRSWRRGAAIGKVSNGSGYSAGRAAGDRVNLGSSKGALPKGQDTFR